MSTASNKGAIADRERFKELLTSVMWENADEIGDQIERAHGKIWAARLDVSKTILSLASGVLVLTLTFIERLLPAGGPSSVRWLIGSAWVTLILCCAAALLSLWTAVKLRAAPAMIRNQTDAAHDHVLAEAKSDEFDLRKALLESPLRDIFEALESADRSCRKFTGAALWLLLVSLLLLASAGMAHFVA